MKNVMSTKCYVFIITFFHIHYLTGMIAECSGAANIKYLWQQSLIPEYLTNEEALPLIHTSKELAIFFTQQRQEIIERFNTAIAPRYAPKEHSERVKTDLAYLYEIEDTANFIFPRFFRSNTECHCIGLVTEWERHKNYERGRNFFAKLTFLKNDTIKITTCDVPYLYKAYAVDDGRYWLCSPTDSHDPRGNYHNIVLFNADSKSNVIEMPALYKDKLFDRKIAYSRGDASFIISSTKSSRDCDDNLYASHTHYYLQINNEKCFKTCKTYTTDVWGLVKPFDKFYYLSNMHNFLITNGVKTEIPKSEVDETGWAHADVLFSMSFDNPLWPIGMESALQLYERTNQWDTSLTTEQLIQIYAVQRWAGMRYPEYDGPFDVYVDKHPEESAMKRIIESYPIRIPNLTKKANDLRECIDSSVDNDFSIPATTGNAMRWFDNQVEYIYHDLPIHIKVWHFPKRYIREKVCFFMSKIYAFLARCIPYV